MAGSSFRGDHQPLSGRTILVTGSSGFIGRPLCRALLAAGASVRGAVRGSGAHCVAGIEAVEVPDILHRSALRTAARGVDAVVHLAARAHVMQDRAADPLAEHRLVNVEGTRVLLKAAVDGGARSVIFTSTVKAVGETSAGTWTENVLPAPVDPYGRSKLEAEEVVRAAAAGQGLHASILRLPLVYGPGVKGNMLRLLSLVDRGIPLPVGSVSSCRSLLFIENLTTAVIAVLAKPVLGCETFFVSDGEDVSLARLITLIGDALGKPARLIPVPIALLRLAGRLGDILGAGAYFPDSKEVGRLVDSLVVDSSKLSRLTGYLPPYTVEDGLRRTAEWYQITRTSAA